MIEATSDAALTVTAIDEPGVRWDEFVNGNPEATFCHVAAWEYAGDGKMPIRNEEPLSFESVKLVERSYK